MLNPDFKDILSLLCEEQAEFLVVGAYALAAHGFPRATGDLDIWINREPKNVDRVLKSLIKFGAPMDQISKKELQSAGLVFQIGISPRRIDILTSITGVEFPEARKRQLEIEVEGLRFSVLGKEDYIANKKAVGRPQDLADIDRLERS